MPRRVALIVGAQHYQDPQIHPLQFAGDDAVKLAGFLEHRAGYDSTRAIIDPESDELVLDSAREMVAGLEAGDLFLFYFSGHGMEFQGRHLLLCPRVEYGRLKWLKQAVQVDQLREETEKAGVDRVFILDACRGELLRTKGTSPAAFHGERILRDIVASQRQRAGAFAMLCSCGENEVAAEVPGLRRGLFTAALLGVLSEHADSGLEARLSEDLTAAVAKRMSAIASQYGLPSQDPWVASHRGSPVVVPGTLNVRGGAAESVVVPEQPQPPEAVVMPEQPRLAELRSTGPEAGFPMTAEQARAIQAAAAEALRLSIYRDLDVGSGVTLKLSLIPAGTSITGWYAEREVRISKAFYLGVTQVTQEQWQSVMGNNPSRFEGSNRPVENVSWDDAVAFCRKLSDREGAGCRLPRQTEWEHACRAGAAGPYAGTGRLDDMGWYKGNSGQETHLVGAKEPNAWGLYDMHGNVWEWCSDRSGESTTAHVLRGGCWYAHPKECRSDYGTGSSIPHHGFGFRLTVDAPQS